VLVSHDRYFIDQLATRVFEVGGGRVEIYPGNYEDYLWRKQGGAAQLERSILGLEPKTRAKSESPPQPSENKTKRLNPIKRKHMEQRLGELEAAISRLETSVADCELSLSSFLSTDQSERQGRELLALKEELRQHLSEWEQLSHALGS
jgi:ATP-binding cassette subfamily F protein 3